MYYERPKMWSSMWTPEESSTWCLRSDLKIFTVSIYQPLTNIFYPLFSTISNAFSRLTQILFIRGIWRRLYFFSLGKPARHRKQKENVFSGETGSLFPGGAGNWFPCVPKKQRTTQMPVQYFIMTLICIACLLSPPSFLQGNRISAFVSKEFFSLV